MTFERYEKRKEAIALWYNRYIETTYTKLSRFGHLAEYHLNKTDAFLMKRCADIRKNTSSFVGNPEDVMAMIRNSLIRNREEIIEYLANEDDKDVWELIDLLDEKVGGKIITTSSQHDWSKGALSCTEYKITLKKDPTSANHFVITSAYPFL